MAPLSTSCEGAAGDAEEERARVGEQARAHVRWPARRRERVDQAEAEAACPRRAGDGGADGSDCRAWLKARKSSL